VNRAPGHTQSASESGMRRDENRYVALLWSIKEVLACNKIEIVCKEKRVGTPWSQGTG